MEKARKLLFTILYAVGALLALFLFISDLDLVGRFPPEIQFQFIISIILFFPLIGFQVWNFISFNKGNIGEKRFTASLLVWAYYFSWHIINLPDLIYAPEHTSPISIIFFVLALAIGNVATFVKFDKYPIVSKILIEAFKL